METKKELLEKYIILQKKWDNHISKLYEAGYDIINSKLYNLHSELDTLFLKSLFQNEEAIDLCEWYLYEYNPKDEQYCKENAQAWDENNEPIAYDFESLWNELMKISNEEK